jgi:hypothetical protein
VTEPLSIVQDRGLAVPPGAIVRTGYVEVHKIRLACRERMAVGDVAQAYQKRLQLGANAPWPPPYGVWAQDGWFEIHDGRHEYVATLMLGHSHVFVAWIERPE